MTSWLCCVLGGDGDARLAVMRNWFEQYIPCFSEVSGKADVCRNSQLRMECGQ